MKYRVLKVVVIGLLSLAFVGCASYRTSSNIPEATDDVATDSVDEVIITENSMSDREFEIIGPIEVKVSKLTAFHKDPTEEQANEALIEKARAVGADAVIDVIYKSGVGFTTWGYIEAKGTGVRFTE